MGPLTRSLIIINVVVFGLEVVFGDAFVASFALWPVGRFFSPDIGSAVSFHVWQLVTSAFLHADPTHLLLNMFALWMFGRDVEYALGTRYHFGTYAAVLSSALVQLLVEPLPRPAALKRLPQPIHGQKAGHSALIFRMQCMASFDTLCGGLCTLLKKNKACGRAIRGTATPRATVRGVGAGVTVGVTSFSLCSRSSRGRAA